MFKKLFYSEKPVLTFDISHDTVYALSGKSIISYNISNKKPEMKKDIFRKEGLSRKLVCDGNFIYCKDFCNLHILSTKTFDVLYEYRLGEDLSSDICGLTFDDKNIYASIRGGSIVKIDKITHNIKKNIISDSSIWEIKNDSNYIYGGDVNGVFYQIDKESLEMEGYINSHKNNCDGFIFNKDIIISTSKDKMVKRIKKTMEIQQEIKKPHKYSYSIIEFWKEYFITIAFRDGVIRFWETENMNKALDINIATCLTGYAQIYKDILYFSSRANNGLEYVELSKLIGA